MNEPKYDEDVVNLGYLKKVLDGISKEIELPSNISKHYATKPNPPYNAGDTWINGNAIYTCIKSRTVGVYTDSDWVTESGAKQEAENKNKVYLIQPTNYKHGDLWILQSDEDHPLGKKGEILLCTTNSKEYDETHWTNDLSYVKQEEIKDFVKQESLDNLEVDMDARIKTSAYDVKIEAYEEATGTIITLLNNGYLTAEQVNALVEGNTEEIVTIKNRLEQTITDSQMQIAITTALEGGVTHLKNTLFTINEQGMWIATNQDEFNALYNNKGMHLYSYDQMIAEFDVNGATMHNLKVKGEIETENLRIMNVVTNGEKRTHVHWIGG